MKNSYKFFRNHECEYFPCHKVENEADFNCLFCYCPLYSLPDCGGNYTLIDNKIKDCSNCLIPHNGDNYDYIMRKLKNNTNNK
ncbi:MAG: cysteine-rich small domain-containing protein [Ruminococcus sp.]|nr:cysteine-rich small domain-containing protein [Ruminococcus sp.]